MKHLDLDRSGRIATVTLNRGKVNALNHDLILELHRSFEELERDDSVGAVVLTGSGSFFTFGFDIPEFMSWSKDDFIGYLTDFTGFYARCYLFPKPVVAALNGHTIAGGCMIALACDRRIMAEGKGRISLNEIAFGASVFAGCVEMLRGVTGNRIAETILLGGEMYLPEEAFRLGLVDRTCPLDELQDAARGEAAGMAGRDAAAFTSIKKLIRAPVAARMQAAEADSIREFADIWYSEPMRKRLKKIEIRKG